MFQQYDLIDFDGPFYPAAFVFIPGRRAALCTTFALILESGSTMKNRDYAEEIQLLTL